MIAFYFFFGNRLSVTFKIGKRKPEKRKIRLPLPPHIRYAGRVAKAAARRDACDACVFSPVAGTSKECKNCTEPATREPITSNVFMAEDKVTGDLVTFARTSARAPERDGGDLP